MEIVLVEKAKTNMHGIWRKEGDMLITKTRELCMEYGGRGRLPISRIISARRLRILVDFMISVTLPVGVRVRVLG